MADTKPTTTTLTPDQVMAMLNGKNAGAISAPQGQSNVLVQNTAFDPNKPLQPDPSQPDYNYPWVGGAAGLPSPNATPKAATQTPVGSADIGYWLVDPVTKTVTNVVPPKTPNADEEMNKALERINRQQEMTEKQANAAAGRGYQSNADYAKMANDAAATGLRADELKEKIRQFDLDQGEKRRQFDIEQAAKDKKANDDLLTSATNRGLTGAQTAKTGLESQQIGQNIEKAQAMLPGELKQQAATLAGTQATTAGTQASTAQTLQSTQIAGAPTVQTPQTGMYTWQRDPKTGVISQTGINPEYIPKTQAEIAARVGQINDYASRKSQEVQGKVGQIIDGKQYTPDDALKEFNTWYDSNVAPQTSALQAAQQAAQFQQAKDEAAMRTSAYTSALGAGTQAVNAFQAMQKDRVGPGWEAASKAASSGDFNALGNVANAVSYQAPDITQTANDAVMNALKYISPTAAAATGTPVPNYQAIDIGGNLNRTRYMPGGQPQPLPGPAPTQQPVLAGAGAGAGASSPAEAAATGQVFDWGSLMGRLTDNTQANAIAAQNALGGGAAPFKTGWPGSDPRLTGAYDPTQYVPPIFE